MRDIEVKLTEIDNNEKRNRQLINANVYIIIGFIKWLVCICARTHTIHPPICDRACSPSKKKKNLFSTW